MPLLPPPLRPLAARSRVSTSSSTSRRCRRGPRPSVDAHGARPSPRQTCSPPAFSPQPCGQPVHGSPSGSPPNRLRPPGRRRRQPPSLRGNPLPASLRSYRRHPRLSPQHPPHFPQRPPLLPGPSRPPPGVTATRPSPCHVPMTRLPRRRGAGSMRCSPISPSTTTSSTPGAVAEAVRHALSGRRRSRRRPLRSQPRQRRQRRPPWPPRRSRLRLPLPPA